MRPRELTLQGFRSYRERATFDLRDRRLVGIVGPIGAGKSTILDGIVFALYGKTPAFEGATRSLINQLADGCHVELVFEVDGQVWRAQRALRRRGQSQHRLERLAKDAEDAEVLETVLQERPMRQRVEQLLGMGFDAFCRSVLLAQNRFAEFLKATPTDRNAVLKGVFGYERFDAALAAAKDRVRDVEVELDALAREGSRLEEARGRLDEARHEAETAAARHLALDAARERLDLLTETRDAAARLTTEAEARIELLKGIVAGLPDADALEEVSRAAGSAADDVDAAEQEVRAADETRKGAEAELAAIEARVGGRSAFEAFAELVATHEHQAKAVGRALAAVGAAEAEAKAARTAADELAMRAATAEEALTEASASLEGAEAVRAETEEALHIAQHAEMAHELRRGLHAGEPCPVCAQVVERPPRIGAAPKVATADRALARARSAEQRARTNRDRASTALATATEQATAAVVRGDRMAAELTTINDAAREAETALAATKSELVDRLGDGDPRALLDERRQELKDAEGRVRAGGAPMRRTAGSRRSPTSSRPPGASSASPDRSGRGRGRSEPPTSSSASRSSGA